MFLEIYLSPSICNSLFPDVIASAHISSIYWICSTFLPLVIKSWIMFSYFKSTEFYTIKGHEHPVVLLIIDFIPIGELFKLVQRLGKRSNAFQAVAAV